MQLGALPPGQILVYSLARFQGAPIPLALHAAALRLTDNGIVSLRLVSVVAATLALGTAAIAVRERLGAGGVLWMLGLAILCPLYLAYGRLAEYVALSLPHAALAFALLLRFEDRRDVASAAVLGVVLGLSIYLYQESWFVPPLVAATFLIRPDTWSRRIVPRLALAVSVA